jgi:hypothetical protein
MKKEKFILVFTIALVIVISTFSINYIINSISTTSDSLQELEIYNKNLEDEKTSELLEKSHEITKEDINNMSTEDYINYCVKDNKLISVVKYNAGNSKINYYIKLNGNEMDMSTIYAYTVNFYKEFMKKPSRLDNIGNIETIFNKNSNNNDDYIVKIKFYSDNIKSIDWNTIKSNKIKEISNEYLEK